MSYTMFLMATYGLFFALANKVPFLHGKINIVDRLLACSYCLGFHCGWATHLLMKGNFDTSIVVSAFAGATFCYSLDTLVEYIELKRTEISPQSLFED